ncbi:GGDEF domain-containing protein [Marinobacterium sp. CAU 1594]|nr:GGDEF domain-containing protein [Marinobacterium arenosum]
MRISDVEINNRMELLNLDKASLSQLTRYKQIIEENVDAIVDEFYSKQTEIDEISLLIGDADTLSRLSTAQRRYVIDLFAGHYDSEYVNNRLRIGMVHKRIGVEPKLYLSAVRSLEEIIVTTLRRALGDSDQLSETLVILNKLIYFDITLVFDTYIDSLVGEIETAKKRTELYAKSLEEKVAERTRQLEEQAKMDSLTHTYNQRAMKELLRRELTMAKRRKTKLSLLYFDIDNFKEINDTYGHIKGDEVLKAIGQILTHCLRETDIPCRYGGDEFCVVLPECQIADANEICERLLEAFHAKYPDFHLSIGMVETGPDEYFDEEQLIKKGDEKMYLAKKESGSQVRY